MKQIALAGGRTAFVDDADYVQVVAAGPWHARRNGRTTYAQRHVLRADGVRTTQQLHTFLTGWSYVDHRNCNGLDNQRTNLRQATQHQNNANSRARNGTTSAFKGVSWRKRTGNWCAQIRSGDQNVHLGYFDTEEDAARAYDLAACDMFGEFARANFSTLLPPGPRRPRSQPRSDCRRGHPFTPENTITHGPNRRTCRTCKNAAQRRWADREKAKQ
jgi:hypothetical protein